MYRTTKRRLVSLLYWLPVSAVVMLVVWLATT